MSTRDTLLEHQLRWAEAANIAVDARGYVGSVDANLWRPLSRTAMRSFELGSGSELKDTKARPAKMRALHSSSALAVNVFDYWCERNATPLLSALDVGPAIEPPRFEAQYPTGLKGNPPNLDIAIRLKSGVTLAVESKFCEWLTPKPPAKRPFKEKYFAPIPDLWARVGLPCCQSLANDIRDQIERFLYLDAPQLLKHALGLATQLGNQFSLCYLYYDWPSAESEVHRTEVARFVSRVGTELRFRTTTYQMLFRRLMTCGVPIDPGYTEYLQNRYFKDAA